ncbi:MAG: error-prone DNA polymerase [Oligoflexia bacterium]|nr:error-prone DNA polymerase [Oligoflexia bacterium]
MAPPNYVELQAFSNFSFLRGASHPHELIEKAAALGYAGLALTDYHTMSGIVRAYSAARTLEFPFFVGCRLELACSASIKIPLLCYPTDRDAYGRLCALLTKGKLRAERDECELMLEDYLEQMQGFVTIFIAPSAISDFESKSFLDGCRKIKDQATSRELVYTALSKNYLNHNDAILKKLLWLSRLLEIDPVATGNVYYHAAGRKPLQDVLTCVRHGTTVQSAGFLLAQNSERYLKAPAEIARLFREMPEAVSRTMKIAELCSGFSLPQLKYEYPDEICPHHKSPAEYLKELTYQGAQERYPAGTPTNVLALLQEEFELIRELDYEKYFLTCFDIVKFARSKGILCQGRGAAANSAVCFCLGITSVDPQKIDLLFARFVSKERNEPPDIDIDFEHERREEVIQYIYGKYGRARAGLTCEVITYRHRSAVRDVGKALGLQAAEVDKIAKSIYRWTGCTVTARDVRELGLDPDSITVRNTFELTKQLIGFPRHLSQHVGGFIISAQPLCETVPIRNAGMPERTMIEWDKDDIEILGMLKIDVLGLGMLSCIRKALSYINHHRLKTGEAAVQLHNLPADDPAVYDMICAADTVGVFQIESRAQMSMLPRLRPRCFYDLVIEVAIVRPGPIQGNMVHPYLKRRNGIETISYPDRRVEQILGKTMGVPLFQEQAMRLAIVLANFTPGEAEQLRRAMASWKRDKGVIAIFQERIVRGMLKSGYSLQFAESCMNQIKGFSEYGFPESHAASFALLVYASSWIKRYYPAQFAAALINSQPMGFYSASQLLSDAKAHGVAARPIDINYSQWDCTLEGNAIRLGMRLVKGLQQSQARIISDAVKSYDKFVSLQTLWNKTRGASPPLRRFSLEALARADAFRSLGLNSREAFWQIRSLIEDPLPFDQKIEISAEKVDLPLQTPQQSMFQDYRFTGLSLRGHPIGFIRTELSGRGASTSAALKSMRRPVAGLQVSVAGISIVKQRPHTAKGVVFVSLEDETGITNLIIRPPVFEKYQKEILASSCLLASGVLERVGEVVYVNVFKVESLDQEVTAQKRPKFDCKNYSY